MSLDFWRQPTGFSDAASQIALLRDLPRGAADPDANFEALRAAYCDPRLAVPATVFNHVLNRAEAA